MSKKMPGRWQLEAFCCFVIVRTSYLKFTCCRTFISVVVMRLFTAKSDEIRVNGSPRNRQDLIKMFESAGICNDNRYVVLKILVYIVE